MSFHAIVTNYESQTWQQVVIATTVVILLLFTLTYLITFALSGIGTRTRSDQVEAPPVPYYAPLLGNVFAFAFDTLGTMRSIM